MFEVEPLEMEILDGTLKAALALFKDTVTLWLAAVASVTVQDAELADCTLLGTHAKEEIRTTGAEGGNRFTVKFAAAPAAPAVIDTALLAETKAADPEKVAEVLPAVILSVLGTVKVELLLPRLTAKPPLGAAPVRVTVHSVEPGVTKLLGAHDNPLKPTVWLTVICPPAPDAVRALPSAPTPSVEEKLIGIFEATVDVAS